MCLQHLRLRKATTAGRGSDDGRHPLAGHRSHVINPNVLEHLPTTCCGCDQGRHWDKACLTTWRRHPLALQCNIDRQLVRRKVTEKKARKPATRMCKGRTQWEMVWLTTYGQYSPSVQVWRISSRCRCSTTVSSLGIGGRVVTLRVPTFSRRRSMPASS